MKPKGETGYFREEYAFNSQRANCAAALGIFDKTEYEMWTIFVQQGLGVQLQGVSPDRFTSYKGSVDNWEELQTASRGVNVKGFRKEEGIAGWVSDEVIREAWMISRLLAVENEAQRLENRAKAYRYRLTGEVT